MELKQWTKLSSNQQLIITRNDEINAIIQNDNYEQFPNLGYSLDSDYQKAPYNFLISMVPYELTELSSSILELEYFYGAQSRLLDISFLELFTKLKVIDLSDNHSLNDYKIYLNDISSLKKCTELEELYISKNQISTIEVFQQLKELKFFNGWINNIKDITPLKHCTKLEGINISANIGLNLDTTILTALPNLKELHCAYIGIEDISFIKEMKQLVVLDIGGNKIKDLSPVFELPNLKFLNVADNPANIESYDWNLLKDKGVYLVNQMGVNEVFFYKYIDMIDKLDFRICYG